MPPLTTEALSLQIWLYNPVSVRRGDLTLLFSLVDRLWSVLKSCHSLIAWFLSTLLFFILSHDTTSLCGVGVGFQGPLLMPQSMEAEAPLFKNDSRLIYKLHTSFRLIYFIPNTIEMLCTRLSLYCAVRGNNNKRESLHAVRTDPVLFMTFSNHSGWISRSWTIGK